MKPVYGLAMSIAMASATLANAEADGPNLEGASRLSLAAWYGRLWQEQPIAPTIGSFRETLDGELAVQSKSGWGMVRVNAIRLLDDSGDHMRVDRMSLTLAPALTIALNGGGTLRLSLPLSATYLPSWNDIDNEIFLKHRYGIGGRIDFRFPRFEIGVEMSGQFPFGDTLTTYDDEALIHRGGKYHDGKAVFTLTAVPVVQPFAEAAVLAFEPATIENSMHSDRLTHTPVWSAALGARLFAADELAFSVRLAKAVSRVEPERLFAVTGMRALPDLHNNLSVGLEVRL